MTAAAPTVEDVSVVVRATTEQEFTEFARRSMPALYRIAYLLCGDEHRAHDLTQLALERTFRAWPRVRDGSPFAYARRAIATSRIDAWRRTRRDVLREPQTFDRAEEAREPTVHERDRLVRALAQLPPRQRRVVVLRYLLDRTEQETAEDLGISRGAIKSAASRGLANLRTVLGTIDEEPQR